MFAKAIDCLDACIRNLNDDGKGKGLIGDDEIELEPGMSVFVGLYIKHVIYNPYKELLEGILFLYGDNIDYALGQSYMSFLERKYKFYKKNDIAGPRNNYRMKSEKKTKKFVALLRGINVGGHHKLPMPELRSLLEKLGFEHVITLLNSGNVIFDAVADNPELIEKTISESLEKTFGFPVPTLVRKAEMIHKLFISAPFQNIEITKDIRLYVSFLKENVPSDLVIPWESQDNSFKILSKEDKTIASVLDLSVTNTPKAMEIIERSFRTDITTRNWKTIERIYNKL